MTKTKALTTMLASLVVTTACTTTPSPIEAVAEPNFQARLSDVAGNIEGGINVVRGNGSGNTSILTTLGEVPAGVRACLRRGESWAEIGGDGVCADGSVSP